MFDKGPQNQFYQMGVGCHVTCNRILRGIYYIRIEYNRKCKLKSFISNLVLHMEELYQLSIFSM